MRTLNLFFAAILFVLTFQVNAQTETIEITKSQIINASADEVWERVRKLDNLEEIMPNFIGDSWLVGKGIPEVGVKRSCSAPGVEKGVASYSEQVIDFDDTNRYYSYEIIEGIPVTKMVNSWRIVDIGYKKSMIIWQSTGGQFIENPQMSKDDFVAFMGSAGDALVNGLKKLHE